MQRNCQCSLGIPGVEKEVVIVVIIDANTATSRERINYERLIFVQVFLVVASDAYSQATGSNTYWELSYQPAPALDISLPILCLRSTLSSNSSQIFQQHSDEPRTIQLRRTNLCAILFLVTFYCLLHACQATDNIYRFPAAT